eukprot:353485-Chlamydomonas_euryale.AAC.3
MIPPSCYLTPLPHPTLTSSPPPFIPPPLSSLHLPAHPSIPRPCLCAEARSAAAAAAAAKPIAPSGAPADTTASGKTGTFVSTGNRLKDKLLKEKGAPSGGGGAPPQPPAAPKPSEPPKEEPKFQAFQGKGNKLT